MKHAVTRVNLDNGSNGILLDIPDSGVFYCELVFRGGDLLCPAKKPEVAHFMEHMAFKKNKEYDTEIEFETDFSKNGATFNACTTRQKVAYSVKCADFEWKRILGMKIMMLTTCQFLDRDFFTERDVIKDELTWWTTKYEETLNTKLEEEIHGYDWSDKTRVKLLNNTKLVDLKNFYKQTHYSSNLQFIVAGNLQDKQDEIKQMLTNIDFPNKNSRPIERYDYRVKQSNRPIFVVESFLKKIYFSLLFLVRKELSLSEYATLRVVSSILTDGFDSIINGNVRKKGLAYGIYSAVSRKQPLSSFSVWTDVEEDKVVDLFKEIVAGMRLTLNGGLSQDLIDAKKQKIIGRIKNIEWDSLTLSDIYINRYFNLGKIEKHPTELIAALESVNQEQLNKIVQTVFVEQNCFLGLIGNKADQYKDQLYKIIKEIF